MAGRPADYPVAYIHSLIAFRKEGPLHTLEWASKNYILLGIPETEQRSALRALDAHADLLAACKATLEGLGNMTSEQFSKGADKPLRRQLAQAIVKGDGELILCPSCQAIKGKEEKCDYCGYPGWKPGPTPLEERGG